MAYTTINKSNLHFNTVTWSGDSTNKNITGVGFQPDLIWGKCRNTAYNHKWYDSVRTFGNDKELSSSETTVQGGSNADQYGYLSGTVSDGFTTTKGSDGGADGYGYWNESGRTYVAWNWKANGTGSANTDGSINTTYTSVNTTAGFSISKYTGTGSAGATVGHGLGTTPSMIIVKNLNSAGNWSVYHKDAFTSQSLPGVLYLNTTAGKANDTNVWGNSTVTINNSVFSLGDYAQTNGSGNSHIAYCFAEKTGYSKFGSYVGNASTNGTFIYTGFAPSWVMIKKTNGANHWLVFDNKRNVYNPNTNTLFPASSGVEDASASYNVVDFLSNGMKIRYSNPDINTSGSPYIFMCFGQSLVGSNNIPCNAR